MEKFKRWGLVDVMPGAVELDEGRKDGGVGEMVFNTPEFLLVMILTGEGGSSFSVEEDISYSS